MGILVRSSHCLARGSRKHVLAHIGARGRLQSFILQNASVSMRPLLRRVLNAATVSEALRAIAWGGVISLGIPQGSVNDAVVKVAASTVAGAEQGLFAARYLKAGEIIGNYPGRLHVRSQWEATKGGWSSVGYHACEYVWSLQTGNVLDPTDENGKLLEVLTAFGGLFEVSTMLCRVNEPPTGVRPNVRAVESGNVVSYITMRPVDHGEELFVYYGLNYDRSIYSAPIVSPSPDVVAPKSGRAAAFEDAKHDHVRVTK